MSSMANVYPLDQGTANRQNMQPPPPLRGKSGTFLSTLLAIPRWLTACSSTIASQLEDFAGL